MEENPTTTLPVSETPTPLPTEASAKERPVIPNSSSSVIPGLTRNPESKKKFPLKLIIGIIIFLLLATGAAASYVYKDKIVSMVAKPTPTPAPIVTITPTPIPDPTADWKIHNNLTNGYSFKHPTDWSNMGSDEYEIFVPTLNPSHFPAPKELSLIHI